MIDIDSSIYTKYAAYAEKLHADKESLKILDRCIAQNASEARKH